MKLFEVAGLIAGARNKGEFEPLSPSFLRVYLFLLDFCRSHRRPPSMREIALGLWGSRCTVWAKRAVEGLEEAGLVRCEYDPVTGRRASYSATPLYRLELTEEGLRAIRSGGAPAAPRPTPGARGRVDGGDRPGGPRGGDPGDRAEAG